MHFQFFQARHPSAGYKSHSQDDVRFARHYCKKQKASPREGSQYISLLRDCMAACREAAEKGKEARKEEGKVGRGSLRRGCRGRSGQLAERGCRGRSCSFRAAKRAASHLGPVRRDRGHQRAQEVEQLTAAGVVRTAKAAEVGRGSVKLQARVRVR